MNRTIEQLKVIMSLAEARAATMVPGVKFLGAWNVAELDGITRDDPVALSFYTEAYLQALPPHTAVETEMDGTIIRFR